jgi:16S rRNA pseudouridine516 synthase
MERLDKLLSRQGLGSRSDVKEMARRGRVQVNGIVCTDSASKLDPEKDTVMVDGKSLSITTVCYGMMNKPSGVLTAAMDRKAKTVLDLLPPRYRAMGVMPAGRLDKDTTGLLLFTNDGPLAHFLLSPRRHVEKTYLATVDGPLCEADVKAFEAGIELSDFTALPAGLEILESGAEGSKALVRLKEGKFHQVKRMFLSRGREVTELKRLSFGSLRLDEDLPEGAFRELTAQEIEALKRDARPEGP